MKLPLQIAFHNMPHDAEIESAIRANAEWLEDVEEQGDKGPQVSTVRPVGRHSHL